MTIAPASTFDVAFGLFSFALFCNLWMRGGRKKAQDDLAPISPGDKPRKTREVVFGRTKANAKTGAGN
eukprot:COSAG05_NODE_12361_length_471_cov_0.825269_1_plen_68_part_00